MRTRSPPMLVWATWRSVAFAYVGTGSRVPAAGRGCGVDGLWLGDQVGNHGTGTVSAVGELAWCGTAAHPLTARATVNERTTAPGFNTITRMCLPWAIRYGLAGNSALWNS